MSCLPCHVPHDECSDRQILEFRLNNDTGELYDSAIINPPNGSCPWVSVNGLSAGSPTSPFLFIRAKPYGLVLDTRTRVFYRLPQSVRAHMYARSMSTEHHLMCMGRISTISQVG